MIFWIYLKLKFPIAVINRKGKIYNYRQLSNNLIPYFLPSRPIFKNYISNSSIIAETLTKGYLLVNQQHRDLNAPCFSDNPKNWYPISNKTNSCKTEKHPLFSLLHSFCNNHRTLLLKNSAKETSRVLPSELKPSKSNLALPYLPLIKPQTFSFTTKAMPIV